MKKLLLFLVLLASMRTMAQTQTTLPSGSISYGNAYLSPDGGVWLGIGSKMFRRISEKRYVDSLLATKKPISYFPTWGEITGKPTIISSESDPTVSSIVKAITSTNVGNWNDVYSWGNHALAGYSTASNAQTFTNKVWHGSPIADIYIGSATAWTAKQSQLVSGTNIKTVNGQSLLGSGNITVSGDTWGGRSADFTTNGQPLTWMVGINDLGGGGYLVSKFQLRAFLGWTDKQDFLVSGTNIKTINGTSIVGSGNILVTSPFTASGGTISPTNSTDNIYLNTSVGSYGAYFRANAESASGVIAYSASEGGIGAQAINYSTSTEALFVQNNNTGLLATFYSAGSERVRIHGNGDIELINSAAGIIQRSPNGTRWRITVDNAGNRVATSL